MNSNLRLIKGRLSDNEIWVAICHSLALFDEGKNDNAKAVLKTLIFPYNINQDESHLADIAAGAYLSGKGFEHLTDNHLKAVQYGFMLIRPAFEALLKINEPESMINAELCYLTQMYELRKDDLLLADSMEHSINKLNQALHALAIAKIPEDYRAAEITYPTDRTTRICGVPRDAFHIACNHQIIKLQNSLYPSFNEIGNSLAKLRINNIKAAKAAYIGLQREALGMPKDGT